MILKETPKVFYTSTGLTGLYDQLFFGLFRQDAWVPYEKLITFSLIGLAFLFSIRSSKRGTYQSLSLICSTLGFCLLVLFNNFPVDELFINLRHSAHVATSNQYSFNLFENIEGIVDFLPYFVIGLLAKVGLPIPEMAFLQAIGGGLLCLLWVHRVLLASSLSKEGHSIIYGLVCFFPPLVFNAATGFATTLFTAGILWSFYFSWQNRSPFLKYIILSILPLIRLEGAFWTFLLLSYEFKKENVKKFVSLFVTIYFPLVLLSLFRVIKFGSVTPNPILYKSSLGNLFFLKLGFQNLLSELAQCYALPMFLVFALRSGFRTSLKARGWPAYLLLLLVFEIPYYLSGGDWFPAFWGRYLLPFTLFIFVFGLIEFKHLTKKHKAAWLLPVVCLILYSPFRTGYSQLRYQCLGSWFAHGNYRIQNLSKIGNHFNRTLPESAVVASSEVATLMYFANREALDFMGVANPLVAHQPISSTRVYRRTFPKLLDLKRPSVLWPGDFYTYDVPLSASRATLFNRYQRFLVQYESWFDHFYGGLEHILSQGYKPIIVYYGNYFSTLYFVSPASYFEHLESLKTLGFQEKKEEFIDLAAR